MASNSKELARAIIEEFQKRSGSPGLNMIKLAEECGVDINYVKGVIDGAHAQTDISWDRMREGPKERENNWVYDNLEQLRKEYKNKIIAVSNKKVVASAETLDELFKILEEEGIDYRKCVVKTGLWMPIREQKALDRDAPILAQIGDTYTPEEREKMKERKRWKEK